MTKSGRMISLIDQYVDQMNTAEFRIIKDGFFDMEVCTSLSPDAAEDRANLIPPKDGMVWRSLPDEDLHCHHQNPTHRHVVFVAVRRG